MTFLFYSFRCNNNYRHKKFSFGRYLFNVPEILSIFNV